VPSQLAPTTVRRAQSFAASAAFPNGPETNLHVAGPAAFGDAPGLEASKQFCMVPAERFPAQFNCFRLEPRSELNRELDALRLLHIRDEERGFGKIVAESTGWHRQHGHAHLGCQWLRLRSCHGRWRFAMRAFRFARQGRRRGSIGRFHRLDVRFRSAFSFCVASSADLSVSISAVMRAMAWERAGSTVSDSFVASSET
jgi:hypothetical protein